MTCTLATIWLSESAQLRLELLLVHNARFRIEIRRWDKTRHDNWRLHRKRGLLVERSELAIVLGALESKPDRPS